MKKIYYKIVNLYYKIKFKIRRRYMKITPKGEYILKYLIDRYINCTLSENNEIYENYLHSYIEKYKNKIPDTLLKNVPEEFKEDVKEYRCIFAYLCALLLFVEDQKGWLEYITNTKARTIITKMIGD